MSPLIRYAFVAALALGGIALFLLASSASSTANFGRHYPVLLAINGAIAAALLVLATALTWRLVRRHRARRFGARLMARFAVAFALMGVLPGALIYVVSVQFLSRSIESWFDVRVDRALESGLSIGRAALEAQLAEMSTRARAIALDLAEVPESMQLAALDRARDSAGIQEAMLISASGQLLGASGERPADWVPELPSAADLQLARTQRQLALIEGDPLAGDARSGLRTRVLVAIPAFGQRSAPPGGSERGALLGRPSAEAPGLLSRRSEARFLQMIQRLPPTVAANAAALQSGYRDYQQLSLARGGLKQIYMVTLTLTLILAVFAAVAGSLLLAGSMTAPLLQVAEGTKAVAEGNYRRLREFPGNDELHELTHSFNAMTRQLSEARDVVEARSRELENARAYLERVLANLSAGVVVLDRQLNLVTANHGAGRILGLSLTAATGRRLAELAPEFAEQVQSAFADQTLATLPSDSWQRQIDLKPAPGEQKETRSLLARGSQLPLDDAADADPARRGAPADEAAGEALGRGRQRARPRRDDHRQPGRRHEADGRRLPQLRARAAGTAGAARPERVDRGGGVPVRGRTRRRRRYRPAAGTGLRPAAGVGRRHPAAAARPQPARQRTGGGAGHEIASPARDRAHRGPARGGRRGGARGPPDRRRQRPRFRCEYTSTRFRALRDDQAERHRTRPADSEEDRGRA